MKNIAASVSQRLKNEAKKRERPFVDMLLHYASERFLYRVGQSDYHDTFVLKGGLAFYTLDINFPRPTRDIDLLGFTENTVTNLVSIIRAICEEEVEDDGLRFDLDTIVGDVIKEQDKYSGVRVKFLVYLGSARIPMQIDVGFGDVVFPAPEYATYPTILAMFQAPVIRTYALETSVAEKFHAIVKLYLATTRLKDFYDIWFISTNQSIAGETLCQALGQTFEKRKTDLPRSLPDAYFDEFLTPQNEIQWSTIARKAYQKEHFPTLQETLARIHRFLRPPVEARAANERMLRIWVPDSGWSE